MLGCFAETCPYLSLSLFHPSISVSCENSREYGVGELPPFPSFSLLVSCHHHFLSTLHPFCMHFIKLWLTVIWVRVWPLPFSQLGISDTLIMHKHTHMSERTLSQTPRQPFSAYIKQQCMRVCRLPPQYNLLCCLHLLI